MSCLPARFLRALPAAPPIPRPQACSLYLAISRMLNMHARLFACHCNAGSSQGPLTHAACTLDPPSAGSYCPFNKMAAPIGCAAGMYGTIASRTTKAEACNPCPINVR